MSNASPRPDLLALAELRRAGGKTFALTPDADALREIAEGTQSADGLRERFIESHQTQIEVDEPEEDTMTLLQSADQDRPQADDMTEEQMLRALLEAQGQN